MPKIKLLFLVIICNLLLILYDLDIKPDDLSLIKRDLRSYIKDIFSTFKRVIQ